MNIYVSVGTHEQSFQRLLDEVANQIIRTDDEWIVQYGVGTWDHRLPTRRAVEYLSSEEVLATLEWADVMVSQSSPGNTFGALESGVWPIVLGRQKRFGEHVDDHQLRFASALAEMRLATKLSSADDLGAALDAERARDARQRSESIAEVNTMSLANQQEFRAQAWPLILGKKR